MVNSRKLAISVGIVEDKEFEESRKPAASWPSLPSSGGSNFERPQSGVVESARIDWTQTGVPVGIDSDK